jgi:NAD(P)-dependent dehydrogenase (short-subunit alcohol dehydrogenase family)
MTDANGPHDAGRPPVAVVTGASSGIGLAAAIELGRRGWRVGLLGRDPGRLEAATQRVAQVAAVAPQSFRCDFESFAEVRAVAAQLRQAFPTIDVLANNAGGNVSSRRTTVDGFEATIQGNHLAPFLLTHELLECLRGGRIINTSSTMHFRGRLDPDDLNSTGRDYRTLAVYASAKQANVLFTVEATRRWPDIVSAAFHPGVVRTRFGNDSPLYRIFYRYVPGLRTPEQGARTLVHLATAERASMRPGAYYVDERPRPAGRQATDPVLAERLWEASATAVGL